MFAQEVKTSSHPHFNLSELQQTQNSFNLCQQKLVEFNQAREKMVKFMNEVKNKNVQDTNNIILKFCGKYSKLGEQNIDGLQLIEKRIERMIKNKKIKKNWSNQDMKILCWIIIHYCSFSKIGNIEQITFNDWKKIAELIPGATGHSCMFRVLGLKKTRLSDQKWTQKQSSLLFQIVNGNKKSNWKQISELLFLRNEDTQRIFRNAKQCKQHWCCYLNPNKKKGPWQLDQDIALMQYVVQHQYNRKWTELAKYFQGRTENALKNRYCLIIDKVRSQSGQKDDFKVSKDALKMLKSHKSKKQKLKKIDPEPVTILRQQLDQPIYQAFYLPEFGHVMYFYPQFPTQ